MRLGPAKGRLQQRLDLTEYLDAPYGYAIVCREIVPRLRIWSRKRVCVR